MSNALNRTTKQFVKNIVLEKYSTDDWIIDPDMSGVNGVLNKYWKIVGDNISEMNQAEKNAVDDLTPLSEYKHIRYVEIDDKTEELILTGYTFAGKQFSLSANAQTNILALYTTKDHPAISYPISYNTKDDEEVFNIPDASTLEGMYLTALGTKKAYLDSGTSIKEAIRAAITKAEVDAIIDPR